jgi:hypothetical protein
MRQPVDLRIARLAMLTVPVLLAIAAARRLIGSVVSGSAAWCVPSLHPTCTAVATSGPLQGTVYRNAGELLFSVVAWCFLYRLTKTR